MSTLQSKGYNPNIMDPNDPRFTALSQHPDRWLMANMFGEGDVYAGRGYEQIYCLNTASKNIQVNDFVVLGNRCGRVLEVFTADDSTSDGKVTGVKVYEDMRYLPLDYRNNPVAFGYDDDATKQGRTITYRFGKDTTTVEGPNENGSNVVLFQGTMMILRQPNNDRNTWNSVAQAAAAFQDSFASESFGSGSGAGGGIDGVGLGNLPVSGQLPDTTTHFPKP
jgi:hypothetical protein